MDASRRKHIHDLAEKIHRGLKLEIPVDTGFVAKALGGKIVENGLPEKIDAKIERAGESFKIIVNKNKPAPRNRFSIAHEFGHLFLHMGFLINPDKWNNVSIYTDSVYYRFGHGQEELEANEFAAAFLMPEKEYSNAFKKYTDDNDYLDIAQLADHFGVSKEAALNRGRWLGKISWE